MSGFDKYLNFLTIEIYYAFLSIKQLLLCKLINRVGSALLFVNRITSGVSATADITHEGQVTRFFRRVKYLVICVSANLFNSVKTGISTIFDSALVFEYFNGRVNLKCLTHPVVLCVNL